MFLSLNVWVKEELESEVDDWNYGRREGVAGQLDNRIKEKEKQTEKERDTNKLYTRSLLKKWGKVNFISWLRIYSRFR
jgi:hypothetical protein